MDKIEGFVAYASKPYQLRQLITDAIDRANRTGGCHYVGWEENDVAGRPLTAPIFEALSNANILVADITTLNFNVTFEIGYAIALGRRVYLTKCAEYRSEDELINRIGIFDTLGYETYNNSHELAKLISSVQTLRPIDTTATKNVPSPVYVLETPVRGEIMAQIITRVKKARLFYRSFVPAETARMAASDAIHHVASSYGSIVPLLSDVQQDAFAHNIRAAFIAGLSLGFEIPTLILRDLNGSAVPLDVRDFVKTYARADDLKNIIHDFSLQVYERLQDSKGPTLPSGNRLANLSIGDPMAENEFQTLANYYLQTHEFNRALRGEVNLVVGRKGTGKTALFSQVRNQKRSNKLNVVVDLKPEGYQLIKLKELVLDYLTAGAKHHLITAMWEYLLYSETCRKVLEKDQERHLRDHRLYEPYQLLKKAYDESEYASEGDFSERLQRLSTSIIDEFEKQRERSGTTLTASQVTNLLHATNIRAIHDALSTYLKLKEEIWILFDNLDKGWTTGGITSGDITILRCLIDAARKIQRAMSQDGHTFHSVVFIRNDVYHLLMDETPDFGKETRADMDWRDADMLRTMLKKRLVLGWLPEDTPFEEVWHSVCVSHFEGEESSQFMIERSLMRPRNLIKLFNACRGFAVNLRHEKIEVDDIRKGLHAYSNDVLIEADQELADVFPQTSRLLYEFLGEASELTEEDLQILLGERLEPTRVEKLIEFLLFYGFLGIKYAASDPQYIYDVGYNMEIFKTRIQKNRSAIVFVLNPAFWSALEVKQV